MVAPMSPTTGAASLRARAPQTGPMRGRRRTGHPSAPTTPHDELPTQMFVLAGGGSRSAPAILTFRHSIREPREQGAPHLCPR